ncbi:MAG TPA: response regulator transcription factor [Spirochaetia bacterium]|nr:response regulator transcription factor [Spirochaetia bacterium]
MRLLVIEDEPQLADAIRNRLEQEGYSVDSALDAASGQALLRRSAYDCLILDTVLPDRGGYEILSDTRNSGDRTPILMLTDCDSVEDRVEGLNRGADDCVAKPFSFRELVARIKALLRRSYRIGESLLTAGDLELDVARRLVRRGACSIELTLKEYAVLEYLVRNKNQLLTRTQIIDHVWHYSFDYMTNIVDVYIRYLRRKVDEDFAHKLICTVRGKGYILKEVVPAD